jgi:DnaJ-class molecular chaperone
MIDKLLEEIFEDCHYCHGSGIFIDFDGSDSICPACHGDGYDLSYKGHQLQKAIMKGEKP